MVQDQFPKIPTLILDRLSEIKSLLEVPAEAVQPDDHDGAVSSVHSTRGGTWSCRSSRQRRRAPRGYRTLGGCGTGLQVPGGNVGVADPDVAVGYGDHEVNLA